MKKVALTLLVAATFLSLMFGAAAWAETMGGPGMHPGQQQGTTQPSTEQSGGMGSGMMGGMGQGMMGTGMGSETMGMGGGMMGGMGQGMHGMMGSMGSGMMGGGMMGGMGQGMMGKFQHLQYLQQTLGLSNDQVNTIYSIFADARKDFIKKGAEIRVGKIELWELLRAPKVDMAAVKDKLRKIEGMRTDLRFARIEKHEKVKSALTPEQLQKLRETYPSHIWGDPSDEDDSE